MSAARKTWLKKGPIQKLNMGPAREWWVGAGVSPSPYGSANQTILDALHEEGCSSRDPPSIDAYLRIGR